MSEFLHFEAILPDFTTQLLEWTSRTLDQQVFIITFNLHTLHEVREYYLYLLESWKTDADMWKIADILP